MKIVYFRGSLCRFPMLPSTGILVKHTVKHGGHRRRFWFERFFHDITSTIGSKLLIDYNICCIIIKIITDVFLKYCNVKIVNFTKLYFEIILSKPPNYTSIRAVNTVLVLHVIRKNCFCFASLYYNTNKLCSYHCYFNSQVYSIYYIV